VGLSIQSSVGANLENRLGNRSDMVTYGNLNGNSEGYGCDHDYGDGCG